MSTVTAPPDTVAFRAARLASTRRSLMTLWSGPAAMPLALDLMGIGGPPSQGNLDFAGVVIRNQFDSARTAELFLADEDMCALIDTAALSMPDQVLRIDDPLSPSGMVGFSTPLADRTGQGEALAIQAISWRHLEDGDPVLNQPESGAKPSVLITAWVSTSDVAADQGGQPAPGTSRWLPSATVMWEIGSEIGVAYGGRRDVPTGTPGFYQQISAAFWTLAKQPRLTERVEQAPARPERRRFARAGIERPEEPVHVIRISRRDSLAPSGEHRHVQWQHQWMVRGHWKRVWLPSTQSHRQQWIAPYRKGPEDKPLIGGERVFLTPGAGHEFPESK